MSEKEKETVFDFVDEVRILQEQTEDFFDKARDAVDGASWADAHSFVEPFFNLLRALARNANEATLG